MCIDSIDTLCIVTEYCANGSLDKYIKNNEIDKTTILRLIKGIANGMANLARQGVVSVMKCCD